MSQSVGDHHPPGPGASARLMVVGLSHHSAPIALLERVALNGERALAVLHEVLQVGAGEAMVVATCNRLELYTVTTDPAATTALLGGLLARHTGVPVAELTPHMFTRYDGEAVEHLFAVACGLDSLAVGEAQILGQLRSAFRTAQSQGSAGVVMNQVMQQALRLGKQVRTDLDLDEVSGSLVAAALWQAGQVAGTNALLIGAGSMGALTGAALLRAGVATITVASRTRERAEHLAAKVGGQAVAMAELASVLACVQVVVTCTSAPHYLITPELLEAAAEHLVAGRRLTIVDLALPGDADPRVGDLAGVELITLSTLQQAGATDPGQELVRAARAMLADEVERWRRRQQATQVVPTLIALREQMDALVATELSRLSGRVPHLDPGTAAAVAQTLHRLAAKIVHPPIVRLQQLASSGDGAQAAALVRDLFAITPTTPTTPPCAPDPQTTPALSAPSAPPVLAAAGQLTTTRTS